MNHFSIRDDYRLDLNLGPDTIAPGTRWIYPVARLWCTGKGLDVGATAFGEKTGFPDAIPIDPSLGSSAYDLTAFSEMDFVFSSHTLEHLEDPEAAVNQMYNCLRHGGILFLYLPYPGHSHWDPHICEAAQAEHKWQPEPTSVSRMLMIHGFRIEYVEWLPDHCSSFVVIGRK